MSKKTLADIPSPVGYAPKLFLSLEGKDVSQIKELKVGEKVEILVTGVVCGLSQRERPDYDNDKKIVKTGDIDLKNYHVKVLGEDDNLYSKMAKEDDDA